MTSSNPSSSPRLDRNSSSTANGSLQHEEQKEVEMNSLGHDQRALPVEEDLMQLARLGELRAIQKLFDSGKYTAASTDEQGITALHWAAINGHYALCHFLISAGAPINAKGGDAAATPVLWASKKCNLEIVQLLLTHGADPLATDDQGYNLLHCATLDGNVFQLILLLHHPEINVDVPDAQGHTSLMWAAYKGYPACVDVLLRWGADVGARDEMGFTALHWALVKGSYACIQKLVEYGADRFAANNEGKTPAVTAKDMHSVRQWHHALADCGYDSQGRELVFPLTFVKDKRKFLNRFFFCWPFVVIGTGIWILANVWVYAAVPMMLLVCYGLQWLAARLLKWAPSDMKHMHKTPFLAGIFCGTLAWVGLRWLTHILPATYSISPLSNFLFLLFYSLTTHFYLLSAFSDPGYIPKSTSRSQQRQTIETLLDQHIFDESHFCTACLIRKPLRSKHCKRCNRCVARTDHHCPWVDNCVAINNHRSFLLYLIFLALGIIFILRLTLTYLTAVPAPSDTALDCAILRAELCREWSKDPFTLITAAWAALQLLWVTMLLFVQLSQIARATTTYESMRGGAAPGPLTTALTTGSTSLEGGAVGAAGAGPDPAGADAGAGAGAGQGQGQGSGQGKHRKKEGCWAQWKKLLGLDTFVATALHGSRAGEVMAAGRRNPFNHGVVRNCGDFWTGGEKGLKGWVGRQESGKGLLGGRVVDYRRLYEVPGGAGMRYAEGGYEGVAGEEV